MKRTVILIGALCLILSRSTAAKSDLSCGWLGDQLKKIEDSKAEEIERYWASAMAHIGANEILIAATRDFAHRTVFLDDPWWSALLVERAKLKSDIYERSGCKW